MGRQAQIDQFAKARRWLDIRSHGFFRVSGIRPRLFLADPVQNAHEHILEYQNVYDKGAQLAVAPECSLTGYSILDLFSDELLQQNTERAIQILLDGTKDMNMVIAFGAPLIFGNSRYNCAVIAYKGEIKAIIPKTHPAEGGEFEDERYFEFDSELPETVDLLDQENIPFGPYIVVKLKDHPGVVLTFQVCQDFWVSLSPCTVAAHKAAATVGGTLNASPEIVGKRPYIRELMRIRAATDYMGLIYVSSGVDIKEGTGESTTDLTYSGVQMISHLNSLLEEVDQNTHPDTRYVIHDLDIRALVQSRVTDKSFARNSRSFKIDGKFREVIIKGAVGTDDRKVYYQFLHQFPRLPFVPSEPDERLSVMKAILDIKLASVAKMMLSLPAKNQRPVVAISGGSDSAVSLCIAALLMDKLERPRSDVIAVTMPGFGTSSETYEIAVGLAKALGVTLYEIPISDLSALALEKIGHDGQTEDIAFENVQAWDRKRIELALAAHLGGFVWGTGDMTELLLGQCTHLGDKESHHNPNGSDPKTLIYFELQMLGEIVFSGEPASEFILRALALKPSPELKRTVDGSVVQVSEDRVGPYVNQDNTIYWVIRWWRAPTRIARIHLDVFISEMSFPYIVRWIRRFEELFLPSQYKRNTLSSGVLQGTVGVSPRSKLRLPGDVSPLPWIQHIDEDIPSIQEIEAVFNE